MTSDKDVDDQYWFRRSSMMYYKYIDILVKAFAHDAENIIDIGSANTKYIEAFYWIPEKFTLDIKNPYSSPNVTAIETDFLTYIPTEKYDFVTCLQVLEHIPQVEQFTSKLFELSDRVLISVPYMWPEGIEPTHINDPVSEERLKQWTGMDPSYSIIVEEPLRIPSKGISQRLICYYGPEEEIDYKKVNLNVNRLKENKRNKKTLEKSSFPIKQDKNKQELILKKLHKIETDQKKYHRLVKLELEVFNLQGHLQEKVLVNQKLEDKTESLKKEINRYQSGIHRESKQQQYYLKEYKKITQSNSWKIMAPLRFIGSLFRKVRL